MGLPLVLDSDDSSGPAAGMRGREIAHARLLARDIGTGLFFMLLPGTLLGVWNLIHVSDERNRRVPASQIVRTR